MDNSIEIAMAFAKAFGDAEYALKRSGRLRQNSNVAEADWASYAGDLGADFFNFVVKKGIAVTLIGEPPRRLMKDLRWAPEVPAPISNVRDLIVNGVCRVRNSYFHGEKFRGGSDEQSARDIALVKEAHAVLNAALDWRPLQPTIGAPPEN